MSPVQVQVLGLKDRKLPAFLGVLCVEACTQLCLAFAGLLQREPDSFAALHPHDCRFFYTLWEALKVLLVGIHSALGAGVGLVF
jgi:3-hydroxymyristoyl/3-hydroxydecanoyl-(acyl carrier protein) dehydratase